MTYLSKLSIQEDMEIQFRVSTDRLNPESYAHHYPLVQQAGSQFITYLNQVDTPVSVPMIRTESDEGDCHLITVAFPGKTHNLDGLTIAVLTHSNGLADPDSVAAATINGPALIVINALTF